MKLQNIDITVGDYICLEGEEGTGVVDRTYDVPDEGLSTACVRWDHEDGSSHWRVITPESKGVTITKLL